jgi:hypothetical protein
MNIYIIIFILIIVIHFSLYYLNIDIFSLSLSNKNKIDTPIIKSNVDIIDTNIEESINQLKNLNKYIDNEH